MIKYLINSIDIAFYIEHTRLTWLRLEHSSQFFGASEGKQLWAIINIVVVAVVTVVLTVAAMLTIYLFVLTKGAVEAGGKSVSAMGERKIHREEYKRFPNWGYVRVLFLGKDFKTDS